MPRALRHATHGTERLCGFATPIANLLDGGSGEKSLLENPYQELPQCLRRQWVRIIVHPARGETVFHNRGDPFARNTDLRQARLETARSHHFSDPIGGIFDRFHTDCAAETLSPFLVHAERIENQDLRESNPHRLSVGNPEVERHGVTDAVAGSRSGVTEGLTCTKTSKHHIVPCRLILPICHCFW